MSGQTCPTPTRPGPPRVTLRVIDIPRLVVGLTPPSGSTLDHRSLDAALTAAMISERSDPDLVVVLDQDTVSAGCDMSGVL
jgi:hypothetical protein